MASYFPTDLDMEQAIGKRFLAPIKIQWLGRDEALFDFISAHYTHKTIVVN